MGLANNVWLNLAALGLAPVVADARAKRRHAVAAPRLVLARWEVCALSLPLRSMSHGVLAKRP